MGIYIPLEIEKFAELRENNCYYADNGAVKPAESAA